MQEEAEVEEEEEDRDIEEDVVEEAVHGYFRWHKSNFGGPCHKPWPDYEGSWAESPP